MPSVAVEALALLQQPPALVEIRFVEAENAERPLDLTLVVALAGEREALARVLAGILTLAEVGSRQRGRPEPVGSQSGIDVTCSLERGDQPHLELAQAGERP